MRGRCGCCWCERLRGGGARTDAGHVQTDWHILPRGLEGVRRPEMKAPLRELRELPRRLARLVRVERGVCAAVRADPAVLGRVPVAVAPAVPVPPAEEIVRARIVQGRRRLQAPQEGAARAAALGRPVDVHERQVRVREVREAVRGEDGDGGLLRERSRRRPRGRHVGAPPRAITLPLGGVERELEANEHVLEVGLRDAAASVASASREPRLILLVQIVLETRLRVYLPLLARAYVLGGRRESESLVATASRGAHAVPLMVERIASRRFDAVAFETLSRAPRRVAPIVHLRGILQRREIAHDLKRFDRIDLAIPEHAASGSHRVPTTGPKRSAKSSSTRPPLAFVGFASLSRLPSFRFFPQLLHISTLSLSKFASLGRRGMHVSCALALEGGGGRCARTRFLPATHTAPWVRRTMPCTMRGFASRSATRVGTASKASRRWASSGGPGLTSPLWPRCGRWRITTAAARSTAPSLATR